MKNIVDLKWHAGSETASANIQDRTSAILAIRDKVRDSYFILPEIFLFDKSLKTFVGEEHGSPIDSDYWFMLETELLIPLRMDF